MTQVDSAPVSQEAPPEDPSPIGRPILATVLGAPLDSYPEDLYIPPEALRVLLEAFEGPLDLLLYLIKNQNLDILALPVLAITQQYLDYINLMEDLNIQLAGEYLLMAATLAEIKSRLLLPRPELEEGAEPDELLDPRAELIRRLQVYECFKNAAERLEDLPRVDRDTYLVDAQTPVIEYATDDQAPQTDVSMQELLLALSSVMKRASLVKHHKVVSEKFSIRERMTSILRALSEGEFITFTSLFSAEEGRVGVVVTFIAILELVRESVLSLSQQEPFAPIYVKMREEVSDDDRT